MRAAHYVGNRTFSLEELVPESPGAGEVQIGVAFCGICGTDLHAYHGVMDARIGHHRVLGHEMSGTVTALGEGVSGYAIGDRVVVRPLAPCGNCPACRAGHDHICHNLKFIGLDTDGAMQDRWNVPAYTLHKLPDGLSLEHAALVEPAAVAVHDVKRARLVAGEDVLVIGGGPIGILIAIVAQKKGASVTLSEVNPNRLAFAEKLGIRAVNPREVDVVADINARTGDKGADVVFEVSGSQAGVDLMTAVAATRGRICMVAIHAQKPQVDMFRFFWRELELIGARVYERADFDDALAMLASGGIEAARLITDVRPLEDIAAAFAELDSNPIAMKTLLKCAGV